MSSNIPCFRLSSDYYATDAYKLQNNVQIRHGVFTSVLYIVFLLLLLLLPFLARTVCLWRINVFSTENNRDLRAVFQSSYDWLMTIHTVGLFLRRLCVCAFHYRMLHSAFISLTAWLLCNHNKILKSSHAVGLLDKVHFLASLVLSA